MSFFCGDVVAKEQLPAIAMLYTPPAVTPPTAAGTYGQYRKRLRPKLLLAMRDYLKFKVKEES